MEKFTKIRKDAIRKKNDIYSKAAELDEKSKEIATKREELDEAKSRIPSDLPEDIQAAIDSGLKQHEADLENRAKEVTKEIDDAQDSADEAISEMGVIGKKLGEKGESLIAGKDIPLVGSFLETKGNELKDQEEQMYDLALEARKYSDQLAESGRRLTNRR